MLVNIPKQHTKTPIIRKRRLSADPFLLQSMKDFFTSYNTVEDVLNHYQIRYKKEKEDEYPYKCYKIYLNKSKKISLLIMLKTKNLLCLMIVKRHTIIKSKISEELYENILLNQLPQKLLQIIRFYK